MGAEIRLRYYFQLNIERLGGSFKGKVSLNRTLAGHEEQRAILEALDSVVVDADILEGVEYLFSGVPYKGFSTRLLRSGDVYFSGEEILIKPVNCYILLGMDRKNPGYALINTKKDRGTILRGDGADVLAMINAGYVF